MPFSTHLTNVDFNDQTSSPNWYKSLYNTCTQNPICVDKIEGLGPKSWLVWCFLYLLVLCGQRDFENGS